MSLVNYGNGRPAGGVLRLAICGAAALLVVSACNGGSGDAGAGTKSSGPPIATDEPVAWEPVAHQDGQLKVDMFPVEREPANTARVRFRVTNMGQVPFQSDLGFNYPNLEANGSVAGVSLVDGVHNKRYYPLFTKAGECACSKVAGTVLQPRQALEMYALFQAPPANLGRIDVTVPMTPMFADVPLAQGDGKPIAGQDVDPARSSFAPARVIPLISTSESYGKAVDEDGDDQTVRLSTDVLFALNKADISPASSSILQDVAGRINSSTGSTVKIDGYTDTTGNDAINEPLSRARAAAVQVALKGMVTRQGLTYQVAGHGSRNPVASNDSEEGRKRNRRVSVRFARPASPASAGPAKAVPTSPYVDGKLPILKSLSSKKNPGIQIQIHQFYRDSAGLATMIWSVQNTGAQRQRVDFGGQAFLEGFEGSVNTAGVFLNDRAAKVGYLSTRDGGGACLCTDMTAVEGLAEIPPKGGAVYYNTFKVPAQLKTVDIDFGQDHGELTRLPIQ